MVPNSSERKKTNILMHLHIMGKQQVLSLILGEHQDYLFIFLIKF